MKRYSSATIVLLAVAAVFGVQGCQVSPQAARPAGLVEDPCAARLHDLAGGLLAYYAAHGRLPEDLRGLRSAAGADALPPCVCPVSGKPYVYCKDGVKASGHAGLVVLYDATPAHEGAAWGIAMETPAGGGPVTAQVVRLAELPASP